MNSQSKINKNNILYTLTKRLEDCKGFHRMCFTDLGITEYEVAEAILDYFFDIPVSDSWYSEPGLEHFFYACIYWVATHWVLQTFKDKLIKDIFLNSNTPYFKVKDVTSAKAKDNSFTLGDDKYNYSDFLLLLLKNTRNILYIYPVTSTIINDRPIGNYQFKKEFLKWYLSGGEISKIKLYIRDVDNKINYNTTIGDVGKDLIQVINKIV